MSNRRTRPSGTTRRNAACPFLPLPGQCLFLTRCKPIWPNQKITSLFGSGLTTCGRLTSARATCLRPSTTTTTTSRVASLQMRPPQSYMRDKSERVLYSFSSVCLFVRCDKYPSVDSKSPKEERQQSMKNLQRWAVMKKRPINDDALSFVHSINHV